MNANPWVAIPRPRKTTGYVLARYMGFMRREFYKEAGAIRVFAWWHEADAKAKQLNAPTPEPLPAVERVASIIGSV